MKEDATGQGGDSQGAGRRDEATSGEPGFDGYRRANSTGIGPSASTDSVGGGGATIPGPAPFRPFAQAAGQTATQRGAVGAGGTAAPGTSGGDGATKPSHTAAATVASANAPDDGRAAPIPPAADGQQGGPYRRSRYFDHAVKRAAPFGEFAQAADKKAATADGFPGRAAVAADKKPRAERSPPMAAARPAPAAEGGPRDFNRFFNTVYQPLSDLAKELGVPEDYLLGHAAYESGYLDNHDFPLNNPFGYTKAGGRNLAFRSIAAAVAAYRDDYGTQIRGATSAQDFAERIEGRLAGKPVPGWRKYNSKTDEYEANVLRVIASVAHHKADWLKQKDLTR